MIMGDADDSYDFTDLMPFLANLPSLHRYVGNSLLGFIGRLFFKNSVGDYYCGLRGFSREAILRLDLRMTGMEFAIEMVVRAVLAGLSIAEVPPTLSKGGRSGPSHLRTWHDGWRTLRLLLLFSPR